MHSTLITFFCLFNVYCIAQKKDLYIIIDADIKYKYSIDEKLQFSQGNRDSIIDISFIFPKTYVQKPFMFSFHYSNFLDFDTKIKPLSLYKLPQSEAIILNGKDFNNLNLFELYFNYIHKSRNVFIGKKKNNEYLFYKIKRYSTNNESLSTFIAEKEFGSTDDYRFYEVSRKDELLMISKEKYKKTSFQFIFPKINQNRNNSLYIYHRDTILSSKKNDFNYKAQGGIDNKRYVYSYRIDTGSTYWFLQLKTISDQKEIAKRPSENVYEVEDLQFLKKEELENIFLNKGKVFVIESIDGKHYVSEAKYNTYVNHWIENSL